MGDPKKRVECPLCGQYFSHLVINEHANICLGTMDNAESSVNFENERDSPASSSKRQKLDHAMCSDTPTEMRSRSLSCKESKGNCSGFTAKAPVVHSKAIKSKDSWQSFFKSCVISPSQTSKQEKSGSKADNYGNQPRQIETCKSPEIDVDPSVFMTEDNTIQQIEEGDAMGEEVNVKPRRIQAIGSVPLAERMRPTSVADYLGQGKIVGSMKPLRALIESNRISSMIFWGPPGCGKTTLAKIIANNCRKSSTLRFANLSAAVCNIADVKEAIKVAKNERMFSRQTILFVDEIHRFNKLQQDAFLPHVEDGTIVLLGATTENPSFHVNSALLSRCRVVVLEKLDVDSLKQILHRALKELDIEVVEDGNCENHEKMMIQDKAIHSLCVISDGDARTALNGLETVLNFKLSGGTCRTILTADDVKDSLQRSHILYDKTDGVTMPFHVPCGDPSKYQRCSTMRTGHSVYMGATVDLKNEDGDEHYHCASALQKSIRGSDDNAAIYWLARMLEGGEDPLFIARRLVVTASEDIGMADQQALGLAVATFQACHFIGLPECAINLAHCTTYLARAAKSNEAYAALSQARNSIRRFEGPLPGVPLHLRNATSGLAKQLGYKAGYKYNHTADGSVDQVYLPSELLDGTNFFKSELNP